MCVAPFLAALLLVGFIREKIAQNTALVLVSVISAILLCSLLKKRVVRDIHKNQAALVMAAIAAIIVVAFLLTGIVFGFYKIDIKPSFWWIFILPYSLTIMSAEILRSVLLAQKSKLVFVISYVAFVWIDFLILCDTSVFSRFEYFIEAIGLAFLPALSSGVLYHYIANKFGAIPNIVYKLMIFLYPFVIPYEPQLSDALISFARIVLPIVILLLMHMLYTPRSFVVAKRKTIASTIATTLALILATGYIMLISQQFQYNLLVVATHSMSGAINKGDAVIYEDYENQTIAVGDVIVFTRQDNKIIHRVMDIKKINGELRYFTKGDANDGMDSGYITDANIVGVINLKIKYIGYPTIWIRSLFE
jgi:signal peptidase I